MKHTMKITAGLVILMLGLPVQSSADDDDDPGLVEVSIDQLEKRYTSGEDPLVLEAGAWIGSEEHRLGFTLEVERANSETEELEFQALYAHSIAPGWDLHIGWRHDGKPEPNHDWLALGFSGEDWYSIEIGVTAFIEDNGQVNLRLEAEYEWELAERWVLSPEVEVNFHAKDDETYEVGSGLSDTEVGLRLRYEVSEGFEPYVGLNWTRLYAGTKDYALGGGGDDGDDGGDDEVEDTNDVQFVVGIGVEF